MSRPEIDPKAIVSGKASPETLFNALEQVLTKAPEPHASSQEVAQLLAELELSGSENMADLSRVLEQRLAAKGVGLSTALKVRLSLTLSLYNYVLQALDLDPMMHEQVAAARTGFVISCLLDGQIWIDRSHPLRWLVDSFAQEAVTWYPELGKQGQKLFEHYRQLSQQLLRVAHSKDPSSALHDAISPLKKLVAIEARRSETLRKRYIDSEQAEANILKAKDLVNELFNRELADRMLPLEIGQLLLSYLRQELLFCLINGSEEDVFWRRWQTILPYVARAFQTPHSGYGREQLFADVHQATGLLEFDYQTKTCSQSHYDNFIGQLQGHLFNLLKDQRAECQPFALQSRNEPTVNVTTQISRKVMARLNHCLEGDWYMLVDEADVIIRCTLAAKMPESGVWLFANRSGHRVADKTPNEFALCLSSKLAKPLKRSAIFDDAYFSALVAMNRRLDEFDGKLAAVRQRQEIELQARQAAADKARKEAQALALSERLAAEKARAELEQKEKEQAEAEQAELEKRVEAMAIGSWIVLKAHKHDETDGPVRAKLAVSMKSTGKYIFVDRLGTKVATLLKAELVTGIESGDIEIIEDGSNFEDQLSRVVLGLRK